MLIRYTFWIEFENSISCAKNAFARWSNQSKKKFFIWKLFSFLFYFSFILFKNYFIFIFIWELFETKNSLILFETKVYLKPKLFETKNLFRKNYLCFLAFHLFSVVYYLFKSINIWENEKSHRFDNFFFSLNLSKKLFHWRKKRWKNKKRRNYLAF